MCQPDRVRYPARPLRMGTGPNTTFFPFCTHVSCRARSTQATRYARMGHFPAAFGFFRAERELHPRPGDGPGEADVGPDPRLA